MVKAMTSATEKSLSKLLTILREMKSVVLGFSGGVDSTLLAVIAQQELKDRFLAVIATAPIYPQSEHQEALELAKQCGFRYLTIEAEIWREELVRHNPVDRCYVCKKSLFTEIKKLALERGFTHVADGSNLDDTSDFRPGMQAIKELGIKSPLMEAGLTKNDIRQISKSMGLKTWDKPPMACLATRFPFGHHIDDKSLRMVDDAETFLRDIGFRMVRVRHIEGLARIELGNNEIEKLFESSRRKQVVSNLKELGYRVITVDLEGYKMGSMNPAT